MITASIQEMEQCYDAITSLAVENVFFGELRSIREQLIEELIETGEDECRYRIKMIDEILEIPKDLYKTIVSDKNSAK